MKLGLRLALAAYIGYFAYSLLVFFWGQSGVFALRDLDAHTLELSSNILDLEAIKDNLESSRDALLYDTDEIRLLSRTVGYYEKDEVSVIIEGSNRKDASHTLGRMIRRIPDRNPNLAVFRAIGFTIALIFAIVVLFLGQGIRGHKIR